jgi:uncharacterized membrane protein YebE (DUF533 family)
MGSFQQELIAGVLATVIGGLILAMLTGSGRGSKLVRFVLVVGGLVALGAFVLSQMRGGSRWRRGDVPAVTQLTVSLAQELRAGPASSASLPAKPRCMARVHCAEFAYCDALEHASCRRHASSMAATG